MRGTSSWVLVLVAACATTRPPATTVDAAGSTSAAETPADEPIPALRLPAGVRPTHYALEMKIDPDRPTFSGRARIDVTLSAPRTVLWLHGRDLAVSASSVTIGRETLRAKWEQVNDDGVVKLSFPRAIGPGAATLELEWTRAFDPRLVGLYVASETGNHYAYTQFQDLHARRAFPCFDEPGFKTPFDVTLVVPEKAAAVANTPPRTEDAPVAGWKRIRFATTRPLPTYLLAWAVGPFDVVDAPALAPTALRGWAVPMRGLAPKGRGGELGFGLRAAAELLRLEEDYFGIAFPYPKLDSVAVPDYAYGAMENAGETHYREDLLMAIDGVTSDELRVEMADTIAHEQAHQWFGDLVTMPWWEDAWLNESFATWMATRMVSTWRPEWSAASDLQKHANRVMNNDSLVSARAIRQPLTSVKNVQDQFDELTYEKGGAVLAMFERFLGPEAFRQGVRAYIAAHADGSGSTDDLLAALSQTAGRDVGTPFRTFLDQAGVPLVQASVSCDGKPRLTLKQSRFFPLGVGDRQARRWQVPVCVRYGTRAGSTSVQCHLLTEPEATLDLPECPPWLLPNADAAGYYRWSMSGQDLQKLRAVGYPRLNRAERISLAHALRAGVASGTIAVADALGALEPIAQDPDGEVALEATSLITLARDSLVPPEEAAGVNRYATTLFAPALQRLGYAATKGEGTSARRQRSAVLGLLAWAQAPDVVQELSRRGRDYAGVAEGKFHPDAIDPDLAGLALSVAVEHGDRALFDALEQRLEATEDGEVRERIIGALSSAVDPERSARVLALSLDPKLRKQESFLPIYAQSRDPRTRDRAWAFVRAHFEALMPRMPGTYAAYLPYTAAGFCDDAHADEAKAFFEPLSAPQPGMPKNLRQAVELIHLCAAQASAQRESARAFFRAGGPMKVKSTGSR